MNFQLTNQSNMKPYLLTFLFALSYLTTTRAEQFLLFDEVFTFEAKDAVPSKSHLFVKAEQFGKNTPKDWTSPIDYRNGSAHIRIEVLEKPAGDVPTVWSLCYIPMKGQNNNYGCLSSPSYTKTGVFEKDQKMTEFWENDSIIWTEGDQVHVTRDQACEVRRQGSCPSSARSEGIFSYQNSRLHRSSI